jgi:hypothetical protein
VEGWGEAPDGYCRVNLAISPVLGVAISGTWCNRVVKGRREAPDGS